MFWGFSESLNLYEEYKKLNSDVSDELNILLFGTGDPRHIIHTMAKSYKFNTKINFYIVDGCIEITARYLLLLAVALESHEMSLKAKTHLFMDLYGNSLLRPITHNYLTSKARMLMKIVTDPDYSAEKAPIFDLSGLKYRERDGLEQAFDFWSPKEQHAFNIRQCWENRVRHLLGTRYDYREGAFDWDLQMKLKDRDAKQICSQEYRHWRDTGVAFVFPEYDHCNANKTLAAGLVKQGRIYKHRGYVGDITVGPFCAFGLKTTDNKMTNCVHGTNDFRATDVTARNLIEMFHEIQYKSEYEHAEDYDRKLGATSLLLAPHLQEVYGDRIDADSYEEPFLEMPNFKINFLSQEDILKINDNHKLTDLFDVVFVGNHYFQFVKSGFVNICREKCLLLFETQARSVLKKDEVSEFLQKIRDCARCNHLKECTNFNLNVDYYVVKYQRCKELEDVNKLDS